MHADGVSQELREGEEGISDWAVFSGEVEENLEKKGRELQIAAHDAPLLGWRRSRRRSEINSITGKSKRSGSQRGTRGVAVVSSAREGGTPLGKE